MSLWFFDSLSLSLSFSFSFSLHLPLPLSISFSFSLKVRTTRRSLELFLCAAYDAGTCQEFTVNLWRERLCARICVCVTRESPERSIKKKRAVGSKFFIMCAKMAFQHQPGTAMECLSVCLKRLSFCYSRY